MFHPDIISRGGDLWGTRERRRAEMTRQMADWRLSPWEETPGSQLGEGTVTRRRRPEPMKIRHS